MPGPSRAETDGRPRRAVDPESERVAATRARLLDAAEQLFLERGPDAVSLRTINAAAELNSGAIHYHFGSKHGLVLALLGDRLAARLHVLDDLARLEAAPHVEIGQVVELAVEPLLRLATGTDRERLWVRLLVGAVRDDPDSTFAEATFSLERWTAVAIRALPTIPPDIVRLRWTYAVALLLAVIEGPVDPGRLIEFLAGGLSA